MAVTVKKSPLASQFMALFMVAGGISFAMAINGIRPLWSQGSETPPRAIPALQLSPRAKDTKLIVHLKLRQVIVYRNGQELDRYPVAIGQAGWETPVGEFNIHQMKQNPKWQHPITREVFATGPDNPLGDRWIGFYEGDHMAIGFHGTPNESLIGSAVSHGCLRMRNQDIQALYKEVGLGTPVEVRN
jgi:lipoprotein-anchoring transpeptidase ErfK/SrfK